MVQAIQVLRFHLLELEKVSVHYTSFEPINYPPKFFRSFFLLFRAKAPLLYIVRNTNGLFYISFYILVEGWFELNKLFVLNFSKIIEVIDDNQNEDD